MLKNYWGAVVAPSSCWCYVWHRIVITLWSNLAHHVSHCSLTTCTSKQWWAAWAWMPTGRFCQSLNCHLVVKVKFKTDPLFLGEGTCWLKPNSHQTILISEPNDLRIWVPFLTRHFLLGSLCDNLPTELDGELGPLVLQTLAWPIHCAWAPAYDQLIAVEMTWNLKKFIFAW